MKIELIVDRPKAVTRLCHVVPISNNGDFTGSLAHPRTAGKGVSMVSTPVSNASTLCKELRLQS